VDVFLVEDGVVVLQIFVVLHLILQLPLNLTHPLPRGLECTSQLSSLMPALVNGSLKYLLLL
jgi:hypothetical protein